MHSTNDTMKALAGGSKEALETLYSDFAPAVYGLALRITESKDKAATVVQEIFRKIWQSAGSFDITKDDLFSWVIGIAKQTAIAHESRNDQFDFFAIQSANFAGNNLREVLSKIDQKHRQVLDLSFFRNITEEQIEQQMNIPVGTVATRLRLAIKAVRETLG